MTPAQENHPLVGRVLYGWDDDETPIGQILAVIPTNSAIGDLILIEDWGMDCQRLMPLSELVVSESERAWALCDARKSADIVGKRAEDDRARAERAAEPPGCPGMKTRARARRCANTKRPAAVPCDGP